MGTLTKHASEAYWKANPRVSRKLLQAFSPDQPSRIDVARIQEILRGGFGLDDGLDLDDFAEDTPLHLACGQQHEGLVAWLLDAGASTAVRDGAGGTPLHRAVAFLDRPQCARLLLDRGAELEVHDDLGHTPLHLAVLHGNVAVAQALLERGARADSVVASPHPVKVDDAGKNALQLCEAQLRRRTLSAEVKERCRKLKPLLKAALAGA